MTNSTLTSRLPAANDTTAQTANLEPIVISRSIFGELGVLVLFLASLVLMLYGTSLFPGFVQRIDLGEMLNLSSLTIRLPLFGLLPLVLGGVLLQRHLNFRYVLTPDYVLEIQGRMQFRRRTLRLHYQHIRGIEIDQTIFEQLFGVGDLILTSDATRGDGQIKMQSIGNPRRIKNLIEERVKSVATASAGA